MEKLKIPNKVAGIKQTKAVVSNGTAEKVYIASDADARLVLDIIELCEKTGTEICKEATKKELGKACGLDVFCAAAAILKSSDI